jgi:hypothetical protein
MSKDYSHVIKNKVLHGGKLISDYQIMTGQGLTDLEMAYIDEAGILPVAPKSQWIIPKGYVMRLFGQVQKIGLEK